MSIGESQSRIKMFIKEELADADLPGKTVDAIANAVAKVINENNYKIEQELRRLRGRLD